MAPATATGTTAAATNTTAPQPPTATATTPAAPTATTAGPPATPTETPEPLILSVYFMRDEKVGTAHREIPHTLSVAAAAMNALLDGPTQEEEDAGMTTAVPDRDGTSRRDDR